MQIALTIAGSDSGGGAGIQADLKTFHQFGVFGTSAIVALTAQNTRGVTAVHPVPLDIVRAQLDALAVDLPPTAIKTGMLATAPLVEEVARGLERHRFPHYVCDPVIIATSGDRLLDADAVATVRSRLVPLAALVTPNLAEAALLVDEPVETVSQMESAGAALVRQGAAAALVKGGHLNTGEVAEEMVDVLVTTDGIRHFRHPRVATTSTHGTGCTLSAAVAAGLALGRSIEQAAADASDFVHRALASAPGLGDGHGPLNHFAPAPPPR
ncbi:MAG: bifunctional hydroxymethylpyrimidine kinase/phosphomethylpyrimidine kinase [Gemmatimonadota bacterium]|jgi:hydroxymethylpyrimidine/phosphomethylpyrimidine kinase